MFSYLVSGHVTPEDGSFTGDLDGENIAADNQYSELRHHYYIWKNKLGQLDFVGVEHYRRMLFLDFLPAEKLSRLASHLMHVRSWAHVDRALALIELEHHQLEQAIAMRQHASEEDLAVLLKWLGNRDIILPRMWALHDRPDFEGQWRASGAPPEMWEDMMAMFGAQPAMQPAPAVPIRTACFNNCFMMRSELFDRYMTALFQAIEQLKVASQGNPTTRSIGYGAMSASALSTTSSTPRWRRTRSSTSRSSRCFCDLRPTSCDLRGLSCVTVPLVITFPVLVSTENRLVLPVPMTTLPPLTMRAGTLPIDTPPLASR